MTMTSESPTATAPASATATVTFEQRAQRIDAALRAAAKLEPEARGAADELVGAIEDHHRAVLTAIVARLRADERGRELLYDVVDDPEVYAALVKAGIVRPTLAMRAVQVLDGVRPYLTSHGGDVELARIEEGIAYVRFVGTCTSCPSSSETLRDTVAEALLEHLPELVEVREEPAAPPVTFIPLSQVKVRPRTSS